MAEEGRERDEKEKKELLYELANGVTYRRTRSLYGRRVTMQARLLRWAEPLEDNDRLLE